MLKRKPKYEVLNHKNERILSGDILSELISTSVFNTFNYLEKKSLLYKIEKDYFSYYNILAGLYKNSDYLYWNNIKEVELIHNNKTFLNEEKFIKFKKNTWTLVNPELKLDFNFRKAILWKEVKEKV
ncbi:hypothetical protein [Staphylococcus gallinarum]|uniref:hypothetical protein n=1 Tax=Staphylococcus TaxID=1279 RepID=UPI000E692150|nr:hypothetical protein [Staphylococcus gallinarum]RIL23391.1 hypothetical protein BUY99_05225 [Staphylococcus gallinarum]